MNLKDVKELVKLITTTDITELNYGEGGQKLIIKREKEKQQIHFTEKESLPTPEVTVISDQPIKEIPPTQISPTSNTNYHIITAPLVGTFYRSSSPDALPYIKEGDQVKKGDTLCIIEAMKLMNEIESDIDGTIIEISKENATTVEFGTQLFIIQPS